MNRCLTLGLLLVCITCAFAQYAAPKVPEVDSKCLDCLCQAIENCNTNKRCVNGEKGGYFCGPYAISWAYWHDSGRPGDKGGKHDFETCLNNKTCAEEAVRGYMRRYGRDCDGNGKVDCYDFVRIHKLGYGGCNDVTIRDDKLYQNFKACIEPKYADPIYDNYDATYNNNNNNAGVYEGGAPADFADYGEDHIQARNGEKLK